MRPGLVVKGRRYWDSHLRQYVTAATKGVRDRDGKVDLKVCLVEHDGVVYMTDTRQLMYLSTADAEMCQRLAEEAKMDWFQYEIDRHNGEVNREYDDKGHLRRTSYRNAIKALSEGLIDQNFLDIEWLCGRYGYEPEKAERRFRDIVMGMGFNDPGPYFMENGDEEAKSE